MSGNKIQTKTIKIKRPMKSWFFERVNKIDKPLARLTPRKQKSLIKSEMKERNTTEIQRIVKEYSEGRTRGIGCPLATQLQAQEGEPL